MATAHFWNWTMLMCQKRPWHGTATISIHCQHPKNDVAESDREWGGLGCPRVLEAQIEGKGVHGNSCVGCDGRKLLKCCIIAKQVWKFPQI